MESFGNVARFKCDLKGWRIHCRTLWILAKVTHQVGRREGQFGLTGLQFTVVAAFVQESLLKSEGFLEEFKRGGDIVDIEDGVSKNHRTAPNAVFSNMGLDHTNVLKDCDIKVWVK